MSEGWDILCVEIQHQPEVVPHTSSKWSTEQGPDIRKDSNIALQHQSVGIGRGRLARDRSRLQHELVGREIGRLDEHQLVLV